MNKTTIIAEAGVNHNGDINLAKKLIDIASDSGADFIKFQSFKAEKISAENAKKADYQIENSINKKETQFEMLKRLELSEKEHLELIKYSKKKKINFFSTAFDVDGLVYLDSLNFNFFKIPSGEINNYVYLKKLSEIGKPVILSTGMANLEEIKAAIQVLISKKLSKKDIIILHCNTAYPTPHDDVNLKAMLTIKNEFGIDVGYSDHTLGIEVPIAAVALGAKVIEKHFTISRKLNGPDHAASLEPQELKAMIDAIRNVEKAMSGSGIKEASPSEKKNINIARKSIHLFKDLSRGSIINESDIIPLRPGDGISPMDWNKVIGKIVVRDLKKFDKITWTDLI